MTKVPPGPGKDGLGGEAGSRRGVGVPRGRRGVIADGVEQNRVHAVGNIRLLGWISRGKAGHQVGLRVHQRQETARGRQFEIGVQFVSHRRPVLARSEHHQVIAGRQHVIRESPIGSGSWARRSGDQPARFTAAAGAVVDFDPIRAIAILVEQRVFVGGHEFGDLQARAAAPGGPACRSNRRPGRRWCGSGRLRCSRWSPSSPARCPSAARENQRRTARAHRRSRSSAGTLLINRSAAVTPVTAWLKCTSMLRKAGTADSQPEKREWPPRCGEKLPARPG